MKPPTQQEVIDYCTEKNSPIDPVEFWNFYEMKGWYVGKTKMQNWHCAVATWERRTAKEKQLKPWEASWVRVRQLARYVEQYRSDQNKYIQASGQSKEKLTLLERHVLEVFGGFKRFWGGAKEETLKFDWRDCFLTVEASTR